jgi:sec-independent protein translocase protein TatC
MKKNHPDQLTFWGHWEELQGRLLKCCLVVIALACGVYPFSGPLVDILLRPAGGVVFTSPVDAFVARLAVVITVSSLAASPFLIYQVWAFVRSGLKDIEKRHVSFFAPLSIVMFVLGAAFAYAMVIPVSLRFLLSFQTELMRPMITLNAYVSFLATMLLAFGIIFELPIVMMFLTKIGVATPEFLVQKRKYAVLIILIVSALITPPDCFTLFLLAVPLWVLYEAGIWFSRWTCPRE